MESLATRYRRTLMQAGLHIGTILGKPIQDQGQVMDPTMYALLRFIRRMGQKGPPALAVIRRQYAAALGITAIIANQTVTVTRPASPIATRLYTPTTPPIGSLLFFHGGGFIMGSTATHDALCRHISATGSIAVLSVDYRLAPEHPFPAAHDDAVAALTFAQALPPSAFPQPLAVGGDSAGANLAASLASRPGIALQWLLYPVLDMVENAARYPSLRRYAKGYLLTAEGMHDCARLLLPNADTEKSNPRLSPINAIHPNLSPAIIAVAGFDPLHDQGTAYGAALQQANVRAEMLPEPTLVHGYADFAGVVPAARQAVDRAISALRVALERPSVQIDTHSLSAK